MNYQIKPDENRLQIFHEGRKRRVFVGELTYNNKTNRYELVYDKKYARAKNAIPIGPELSLFKLHYESEKNKLFPSLQDRIPDKSNPAYADYCHSQGISPNEKNPIILLGTIGKRGPSSFIFEPVYQSKFDPSEITKLRTELGLSQHDLAKAFEIKKSTLQRIEAGVSREFNTLKRIQTLFEFPEVALWQLKQSGGSIHSQVLNKLIKYFESKNK
jgi:DNA-binding XRE family transcriptional regulator